MSEGTPKLYEGLFLVSQAALATDSAGVIDHVKGMLDRVEAEILNLEKWEERKLAYDIDGQKRGTFLISYFRARPSQIANIERDCNLSEQVLRVMFISCDHMGDEELKIALEGGSATAEAEAAAAEGAEAPATEAAASSDV